MPSVPYGQSPEKSPVSSAFLVNISKMWLFMGIDHCSSFLPKTVHCYRYLQKFITSPLKTIAHGSLDPHPKTFINTRTLNIQIDDLSNALASWFIGLLSYDGLFLYPAQTTNPLAVSEILARPRTTYSLLFKYQVSPPPSFQFTLRGTLLHPVIALFPLVTFRSYHPNHTLNSLWPLIFLSLHWPCLGIPQSWI